jgi:pimeloyl-ACP methyl ester carboxylesterase
VASTDCFRGGSGPRLLLLHSGLSTWREWRSVLPSLARAREVMAPTLPGSYGGPPLELAGRSVLEGMADHVEALLDEAGWDDQPAVVGSSHGGVIGLELAARGRAASVVALAPPWMSAASGAVYGGFFGFGATALRLTAPLHARAARWSRAGGLILHASATPAAIDPDDLTATLRSVGHFPLLQLARHGFREPLLPAFDSIRCPVVLVWGTSDRLAPMRMSRRWTRAIPRAELVVLPGFPHFPHLRDPQRIADLILERAVAPGSGAHGDATA